MVDKFHDKSIIMYVFIDILIYYINYNNNALVHIMRLMSFVIGVLMLVTGNVSGIFDNVAATSDALALACK